MCKDCIAVRAQAGEYILAMRSDALGPIQVTLIPGAHVGPPRWWDVYVGTTQLGKVTWQHGHWFPGLPGQPFDLAGNPWLHVESAVNHLIGQWVALYA